tara:strand:+ start:1313 stop:1633 length:321 start_codon:yes stop_codon:yes gene_type:complete
MPNDGSPYPRDFIIGQDGTIEYANNEIDTDWMISIIEDLLGTSNIMPGDINFDEIINILDIVMLVNIILGTNQNIDNNTTTAADLNQDGFINILDVVLTVNVVLSP